MQRIALTGGIACGKSLAASMISEMGIDVIEADEIARDLMQPGTKVYRDVKRAFGPGVFDSEGNVDRKVLGKMVMSNAAKRKELNAIVHPSVIRRWQEWLEERPAGMRAAVVVAPLLYEASQGEGWDAVICLYSGRLEQVARLAERGITGEEAAKWLAAQMKLTEKMKRANFVVCNNGSKNILRAQIERIVNKILEKSND